MTTPHPPTTAAIHKPSDVLRNHPQHVFSVHSGSRASANANERSDRDKQHAA